MDIRTAGRLGDVRRYGASFGKGFAQLSHRKEWPSLQGQLLPHGTAQVYGGHTASANHPRFYQENSACLRVRPVVPADRHAHPYPRVMQAAAHKKYFRKGHLPDPRGLQGSYIH